MSDADADADADADDDAPARPEPGPSVGPRRSGEDAPVLPDRSRDESEHGWGDDRESGRRDADWYRRERPPHHG